MNKFVPVLLSVLLVTGCNTPTKKSKAKSSSVEQTSETTVTLAPTSVDPTTVTPTTSAPTTAPTTVQTSQTPSGVSSSSSKPTTAPTTTTTSVPSSTSQIVPTEDLPNNLTKFYAPSNTPIELQTDLSTPHWWNNSMIDDMPSDDWTFIYGSQCSRGDYGSHPSPSFYSSNNDAPGGLKIDQRGKGFQTPMFHHTGAKLEIKMVISQVNQASDKPDTSVPTGYFLFYDNEGHYLSNLTHAVEQETITSKTTQVHFYVTGAETSSVAYFEFRLTAITFKGSQCYNFGIGSINVNSWERV